MAVGAAAVGGVDRVDVAVEHARAPIDVVGVGRIRRGELGRDRERAGAQHALEAAGRRVAGQDRQRIAGHRFVFEDHAGVPRFSRTTAATPSVPSRRRSTGGCTCWIALPARPGCVRRRARLRPRRSAFPASLRSCRSARTPPQGPLRNCFGQFIGQDMPVELSTQRPHIWQSNSSPLTTRSTAATGRSSALVTDPLEQRPGLDQQRARTRRRSATGRGHAAPTRGARRTSGVPSVLCRHWGGRCRTSCSSSALGADDPQQVGVAVAGFDAAAAASASACRSSPQGRGAARFQSSR